MKIQKRLNFSDNSLVEVFIYFSFMFAFLFSNCLSLDACDESSMKSVTDQSITIGGTTKSFAAAYLVDACSYTASEGTFSSSNSDENIFLVINGGELILTGVTLNKTGDCVTQGSDDYNFYGLNSGVVVIGSSSKATLANVTLTTEASGANALFATNQGTIYANNIKISTTKDSSRGLDATYEGVIVANGVNINTLDAHCASIATDRGEGTITVTGIEENDMNQLSTAGEGSPVIYSTGTISVTGVVGVATGAEGCVIEGENSIVLVDSKITGSTTAGVMLYQSTSGDADVGKSYFNVTSSTITMTDSSIPMFYITNTEAVVTINEGSVFSYESGSFVYAGANRWGTSGSNGGSVAMTVTNVDIEGGAYATASDSSISITLKGTSSFTGGVNGSVTITNEGSGAVSTIETAYPSYSTQDGGSSSSPGGMTGGSPPSGGSGMPPDMSNRNETSNSLTSGETSSSTNTGLIIAIVVVAVALVIISIVLVIVLLWKRRPAKTDLEDNLEA